MSEEPAPLFKTTEELYADLRRMLHGAEVIQLPVKERPRRPADDVWDACVEVLGWQPEPGDRMAAKRYGRLVEALVQVEATPEEILRRARRYRSLFPGVAFTPEAFAKHWSSLAEPKPAPRPTPIRDPEPDHDRISFAEYRRQHATPQDAVDFIRDAGIPTGEDQ